VGGPIQQPDTSVAYMADIETLGMIVIFVVLGVLVLYGVKK